MWSCSIFPYHNITCTRCIGSCRLTNHHIVQRSRLDVCIRNHCSIYKLGLHPVCKELIRLLRLICRVQFTTWNKTFGCIQPNHNISRVIRCCSRTHHDRVSCTLVHCGRRISTNNTFSGHIIKAGWIHPFLKSITSHCHDRSCRQQGTKA